MAEDRRRPRTVVHVGRKPMGPEPSVLRAIETSRGVKGAAAGVLPTLAGRSGFRPFLPGQGPTGRAVAYQPVHGARTVQANRSPFRY